MADLSVAEQRLIGRITGGHVADLTVAQVKTLLAYASTDLSDTASLAYLASPTFTGTPAAPTAAAGTNTTQVATTAFTQTAVFPRLVVAGPATGEYQMSQISTGAVGFSFGGVLNDLRYTPVYISATTTFDRIACYLQTNGSAGALARLGIYGSTANGRPGSLVLDAGTMATDTGSGAVKTITISQSLTPGLYWLGLVCQTAISTIRNHTNMTSMFGPFDTAGVCLSNVSTCYWYQAGVSAGLPGTATPVFVGNDAAKGPYALGLRAA